MHNRKFLMMNRFIPASFLGRMPVRMDEHKARLDAARFPSLHALRRLEPLAAVMRGSEATVPRMAAG